MVPIKVGINVHHLRLNPDTELHAKLIYLFRKPCNSVRKLLLILCPVTERTLVVAPLAKPAVVHNEKLDTTVASDLRQLHKLRLVYVKVSCFPAI